MMEKERIIDEKNELIKAKDAMINDMKKDKEVMVKDKEVMVKDKEVMVKDKEATRKDKEAMRKERASNEKIWNKCLDMMENRAINAEKDLVLIRAKSQAVLANRLILEQALYSFDQLGGTFSRRFQNFLQSNVRGGRNRILSDHGLETLNMLRPFGLNVQPKDVIMELDGLVHDLCRAIHYGVSTVPGATVNGVYVGGSDLRAAALAVCFRQLQVLDHTDVDMILITEDAKPICRITRNRLLPI
jgi:hypothetical protein